MARVTSKLQVTIPKQIAQRYGIEPGAEIEWLPAGDAIRVVPPAGHRSEPDRGRRLELFDRATERQAQRQSGKPAASAETDRGWRRDDLYARAGAG
jgi:bifunctional DNA-binding transcriptional regulator/antitoxin component of YhaV-PrlF toxin-antitoxin module